MRTGRTVLLLTLLISAVPYHQAGAVAPSPAEVPTLEQVAALPANANDTLDVLRQLGATMARPSEATEAQNATQREQLDYMKEKDKKKKDKAEKFMDAAEVG